MLQQELLFPTISPGTKGTEVQVLLADGVNAEDVYLSGVWPNPWSSDPTGTLTTSNTYERWGGVIPYLDTVSNSVYIKGLQVYDSSSGSNVAWPGSISVVEDYEKHVADITDNVVTFQNISADSQYIVQLQIKKE